MTPGTGIVPITGNQWQVIKATAPTMFKSRLFGAASEEQAAAIMLKGAELGLGLAGAFEFIQVIQGKPTLSPRGALALVLRSGLLASMEIRDEPDACSVQMARKVEGGAPLAYALRWTLEEARKGGNVKQGSAWAGYQANMLRWRAVGFVIDVLFPDVIGGLKRADEFGATVDAAGDVVDADWEPMAAPVVAGVAGVPHPTPAESAEPAPSLEDLVTAYGADIVLAANGGRPPATDDELRAVAAQLSGLGSE